MTDMADQTQLSMPEGVLLAHALASRVADSMGIRVFFIKGPASAMQGLRRPKVSTDVDVFVEPRGIQLMLNGLRQRGWRERPVNSDKRTFPKHSVTLDHPEWPCCIDVHFRFPGMENPFTDCFDVMWANTDTLVLAGYELRVPSKALGVLILALHALRSPQLPACQEDLKFLAQHMQGEVFTRTAFELASATGSLAAARPFLSILLPETKAPEWPLPSKEWNNRTLSKEPGSARLIAIVQAPWVSKPKLVWRAVLPRPEVFLSGNIYADMSVRGRLLQHRARWARFLRSTPRMMRDLSGLRGTLLRLD